MAERFKIDQNAVDPAYQVTLVDGNGNQPNLTGATVVFHLRQINTDTDKVQQVAVITGNPVNGVVSYSWSAGDTDTIGLFFAYWTVVFSDLTQTKYPSDTADLIEIVTGPVLGYDIAEATAPWTTITASRLACRASALSGAPNYISDSIMQASINTATDLLYVLSGRQFSGEGLNVIRPCAPHNCYGMFSSGGAYYGGSFVPVTDPSSWPIPSCGCSGIPTIDLGYWPVTNIIQVRVDGVVVDPTTYRLDQNRYLVRMAQGTDFHNDGWPTCQRLDRAATEASTFEVVFESGVRPPPAGVAAASHLACELAKAMSGQACQLPGRVTSVNRQQLSFTMINASMLNDGLTGLYDVDLFIIAYNPHKQRGQTVVWSPDLDNKSYRAGS